MPKYLLYILLILSVSDAKAQYANNLWCFGDSAGLDFSTGTPVPFFTSLDTRGSCVSIADSNNNLLFYANTRATLPGNTTLVWNSNNNIMQNGDSVVGRGWYKELVIVPAPGSDILYYLFSAGVTSINGLYYSVIDMSQDSGRGAVVQKNIQLQGAGFPATDGLAAVKHGNGRDWWVITRTIATWNDDYYFYLITPLGVTLSHVQSIGDFFQNNLLKVEVSDDGNKIAVCSTSGLIEVFDFDRCTGMLSNVLNIEHAKIDPDSIPFYWDCELSPNNRFLYVSSSFSSTFPQSTVLQFDLQAANPASTRDTIYILPADSGGGGLLELAPDNKIYWTVWYSPPFTFNYPYADSIRNNINENLSVINFPDSAGAACGFSPFSVYLGGKRTYYGLPNNPNYELGPLTGSLCDTITSVGIEPNKVNFTFSLYPNPSYNQVTLNLNSARQQNATLSVYNNLGASILQKPITLQTQNLDVTELPAGVYFIQVQTEESSVTQKLVKME